jgi:hypothetical protein
MNDEGCGIGTGLRPGGALMGGPGDGVPTGPPAAYGFVTKDDSDTMELMGSRSVGCLPARFDGGESPEGSALRPPLAAVGKGGKPAVRGSVDGMFVVVTGGWLWNKQKMW